MMKTLSPLSRVCSSYGGSVIFLSFAASAVVPGNIAKVAAMNVKNVASIINFLFMILSSIYRSRTFRSRVGLGP